MDNIYADVGVPTLDRYINRIEIEKLISQRLIDNKAFGSLSLVGLHKIGKTTIVRNMFLKNQENLLKRNIIPIYIVMSNFNSPIYFFKSMVNEIFDFLEDNNIFIDEMIIRKRERFIESNLEESLQEIFAFFKALKKKLEYRIIVVVDEFDSAISLFEFKSSYFQILRQLASEPDYKIGFVFISRRLIESIESKIPATSAFTNVLDRTFVSTYSEKELNKYYEVLHNSFTFKAEIKDFYTFTTGNYPYLMDKLSYYLVQDNIVDSICLEDTKKVYNMHINDFYEQYEKLKNLLIEEDLFDELLQIAFDMPFDIKPEKIQRLNNYGLIDQNWVVFSESFKDYLLSQKGLNDYHKIWNKTENALKYLSKHIYQKSYGTSWDLLLREKYKNHKLKKSINSAEFFMSEEKRLHNQPIDTYYIDTIATSGLLLLIEGEWNYFQNIFGKTKEHWADVFEPIKNVRNVIQHNREMVLDDLVLRKVILHCEEIIFIIDEYFKNEC
jgi:hypothetical protein